MGRGANGEEGIAVGTRFQKLFPLMQLAGCEGLNEGHSIREESLNFVAQYAV
jgi:hypothetical protein